MQESITNLRNSVNYNTVNALSKIYVWSICLEPLLFFLIKNPFIGPTSNISRYLQTIVLVGLVIRFLIMSNLYGMPNPLNIKYRKHVYFIIFALASGLYGVICGAYTVPSLYITDSLNISVIRPLTEYLIALYYFLYFVIFPGYFFKTWVVELHFPENLRVRDFPGWRGRDDLRLPRASVQKRKWFRC